MEPFANWHDPAMREDAPTLLSAHFFLDAVNLGQRPEFLAENPHLGVIADQGVFECIVRGHPSQAMKLAHQLSDAILHTRGAWHFTKIEFYHPADGEPDWFWKVICVAKEKMP